MITLTATRATTFTRPSDQEEHERPIDEEDVQRAHRKAYNEGSPGSLNASSLGSAAALQVIAFNPLTKICDVHSPPRS